MQPRSDAVPPTSFSIRVEMVLVPCVLRVCVLCVIVLRCARTFARRVQRGAAKNVAYELVYSVRRLVPAATLRAPQQ